MAKLGKPVGINHANYGSSFKVTVFLPRRFYDAKVSSVFGITAGKMIYFA